MAGTRIRTDHNEYHAKSSSDDVPSLQAILMIVISVAALVAVFLIGAPVAWPLG